MQLQLLARRYT